MNNINKYSLAALLTLPLYVHATTTVLIPPSDLKLEALSSTEVSISWKDKSSNESGFKIFRDNKLIHTTAVDVEHYVDKGLTASTTYKYEVKATNDEHKHVALQKAISDGNDDVEESASGSVYTESSDLELTNDGDEQTIGLRFQSLNIPEGVTILKAYIQFTAKEESSEPSNLTIRAENTDNAIAFSKNSNAVSSKTLTLSSVTWTPPAWNNVGESSSAQQTSDLSSIVQEVVHRGGWQNGNSISFIITGTGKRVATSYDGNSANAPTLHIEYDTIQEAGTTPPPDTTGVVINEILASNGETNLDPDFYKFSDWIELYNGSSYSKNIGNFYLSDDKDDPKKYKIPSDTTLASHSYLLIWADKKNTKKSAIHTNFKLSSKKGTLTLADDSGTVIDTIKYKKLNTDVAVTKTGYTNPTPSKANSADFELQTLADKPMFSLQGGVFTDSQTVSLSSSEANGVIYYTTDGSIPTKKSAQYSSPINIAASTVLRARVFSSAKLFSEVETKTYLINPDTNLPIVSLTTDSKNLFDDTIGIYADGTNGVALKQCSESETEPKNYAQDWERPAHVEYFDDNHEEKFSLNLDISISGQCSRKRNKKSFKLKLDSKYGVKTLNYKLYNNKDLTELKQFKLRAGNNGFEIGDILSNLLVQKGNMNVDFQAYRTVDMYVNGEYWGVYNLRENKGKSYIAINYPTVNTKKMDMIIEGWSIKEGDRVEFEKLDDFVGEHDFADDVSYNQVSDMIDIDSFIDYMVIMVFSGNDDWIESNERCWREKKPDAKWRWVLDDIDDGFKERNIHDNTFKRATQKGPIMTNLFRNLLRNSTFKSKFKDRFNSKLDTIFQPSYINDLADTLLAERSANITKGRWGISRSRYNDYVGELRNFINGRREAIKGYLNDL